MKFRFHRGSLQDSLATTIEVNSLEELCEILKSSHSELNPESLAKLVSKHYCFDDRIGWDTWIVTIEGYGVLGFANGELK